MPEVEIYCSNYCIYCTLALQLLDRKGVSYRKILVDGKPDLRAEMERRSSRHTVPQIFIGAYHVGGCDDMMALERSGKLDAMLGLEQS
jgi:glutaredoxin 3